MAATNVFMNWTVKITPAGGSATVFNYVTSVEFDEKTRQEVFYADAMLRPLLIANAEHTRSVMITSADANQVLGLPINTIYTVEATLQDVTNKAAVAGGGIKVTLINCTRESGKTSGAHGKIASNQVVFNAAAGASDADPMTVVAL